MKVSKEIKNGAAFITPYGVLTGGRDSENLNMELLEIENNCIKKCIIDFANVKWINSPGIAFLVKRKNGFRKSGKDLHIININDRVKNYLNLTNLSEYF